MLDLLVAILSAIIVYIIVAIFVKYETYLEIKKVQTMTTEEFEEYVNKYHYEFSIDRYHVRNKYYDNWYITKFNMNDSLVKFKSCDARIYSKRYRLIDNVIDALSYYESYDLSKNEIETIAKNMLREYGFPLDSRGCAAFYNVKYIGKETSIFTKYC